MKLNKVFLLSFMLSLFALSGCTQKQMGTIEHTQESASELLKDSIERVDVFEGKVKRLENKLKE